MTPVCADGKRAVASEADASILDLEDSLVAVVSWPNHDDQEGIHAFPEKRTPVVAGTSRLRNEQEAEPVTAAGRPRECGAGRTRALSCSSFPGPPPAAVPRAVRPADAGEDLAAARHRRHRERLPLLRHRLRATHLHQGGPAHQHRRRPAEPHQRGHPLPQGGRRLPARRQPAPHHSRPVPGPGMRLPGPAMPRALPGPCARSLGP